MALIEFTVPEKFINAMTEAYGKRAKAEIKKALNEIKIGFQQQMRIEQSRGDSGGWKRLNPEYAKRKERDYPGRDILSRTDTMMKGYITGVRVVPTQMAVVIDFPGEEGSDLNIRARAHQGKIGRPKNMPTRKFPVGKEGAEDFKRIAINAFRNALAKAS